MNTEREVLVAIGKINDLDGLLRAKQAVEERLRAHMDELQQRIETLATHGIQLPTRARSTYSQPEEAAAPRQGERERKVYVNPNDPSKVWHGRGRKPKWLQDQEGGLG